MLTLLVAEKSWLALQDLHRRFRFVLIGGWAVYLYARSLKSKDIDIVIDYEGLAGIRESYPLTKNDRLKKYEIPYGEFDVDVYVPHFSNPGMPAEAILERTLQLEGFRVPIPEALLLMKEYAHNQRQGTPKGEKDGLDLLGLLASVPMDWKVYRSLAELYEPKSPERLKQFLENIHEAPPLNINRHRLTRLKKPWLKNL